MAMRMRRLAVLIGSSLLAGAVVQALPVRAADTPVVSLDPEKGTRDGSPIDHLPENIRLLDIDLPDGAPPQRAAWSPDGKRLIVLDDTIGDVWEYQLAGGAVRNLTESFPISGNVLRAHYLSNGDVIMCALTERSVEDPDGDRFRGTLWILQRPLGKRAPVELHGVDDDGATAGESCWEGIAVSKQPGSTLIAWNKSSIDFTKIPDVFVQSLIGEAKILTGRIVYEDGHPAIAERTVAFDKRAVSPDTPTIEAQDLRSLPDGDDDPDDELIFTAYSHKGGQPMGFNLGTGVVTDYAPTSPFYEEAEGVDPAGQYVMVERDLAITVFPGMLDIWRLPLDGSGAFERMTTFDYYKNFGANNPVISPDGRYMAFGLKVEGEEGEGNGILLMDLSG
jgi:hypothetical protein